MQCVILKNLREKIIQKRIVLLVIVAVGLSMLIFWKNLTLYDKGQSIDLSGNNEYWKAYLNIQLGYNSELCIQPRRDDFAIPSKITANIISNEKKIYSVDLEYVPDNSNPEFLGSYITCFATEDYFKNDVEEVVLNIIYNENDISILLKNKEP